MEQFLLMLTLITVQEHKHGQNELPNWYDSSCCSQHDCKPIEDDTEIEFGTNEHGVYAIYKPTGHTFYQSQFRLSQDERYHVCINLHVPGNNGALCLYVRSSA